MISRTRALAALALIACGAPSAQSAATNTAADQAHLKAQATEPTAQDPTAARPPPTSGSAPTQDAGTTPAPPSSTTESEPPTRIGARHVLVQWMGSERAPKSVLRTREQALAVIRDVQRRATAGDDLGRLAVEYSDEPNAGARGGSLGRFGRGQMVGAFETAVFKLKVGELSDIVETPFGFHIIQRTE